MFAVITHQHSICHTVTFKCSLRHRYFCSPATVATNGLHNIQHPTVVVALLTELPIYVRSVFFFRVCVSYRLLRTRYACKVGPATPSLNTETLTIILQVELLHLQYHIIFARENVLRVTANFTIEPFSVAPASSDTYQKLPLNMQKFAIHNINLTRLSHFLS